MIVAHFGFCVVCVFRQLIRYVISLFVSVCLLLRLSFSHQIPQSHNQSVTGSLSHTISQSVTGSVSHSSSRSVTRCVNQSVNHSVSPSIKLHISVSSSSNNHSGEKVRFLEDAYSFGKFSLQFPSISRCLFSPFFSKTTVIMYAYL